MPHEPPPGELCLHIYTYGESYGRTPSPPHPPHIDFTISCKHLQPPPARILDHYTGLDPELSDAFFSYPDNEAFYQRVKSQLWTYINGTDHPYEEDCIVSLISCRAGMHRSVAMAERLTNFFRFRGKPCRCKHFDLMRSTIREDERLAGGKTERVLRIERREARC